MENPIFVTKSSMPPFEEYIEEIKQLWQSRWLSNRGAIHKNLEFELSKLLDAKNIALFANGHVAKFDFYVNEKYIIEYDGETHYQYNLHGWHNEEQLKAQQERDIIKNQWCKDNNIPLIRIPYTHLKDLKLEDLLLETSQFIVN